MAMTFSQILFYVFGFIAIVSALMVVTMNNPVRSVLALVLVFFATAGIWILAQVEFLALILVLVYVGAVMTLFLFMVMMINVDYASMNKRFVYYAPVGLIVLSVLVGLVWMVKPTALLFAHKEIAAEGLSNAQQLGAVLYTDYVYAFEIAAVLLLVAIVASIALVNRGVVRSKKQSVIKQIMTRKEDRLRIVEMACDNRESAK